jgi:hypothetical protein
VVLALFFLTVIKLTAINTPIIQAMPMYTGSRVKADCIIGWEVGRLVVFVGVIEGVSDAGILGEGVGVIGLGVEIGARVGDGVFCAAFCEISLATSKTFALLPTTLVPDVSLTVMETTQATHTSPFASGTTNR